MPIANAWKAPKYPRRPLKARGAPVVRQRGAERAQDGTARACSTWQGGVGTYINRETGAAYEPHHDAERMFVMDDAPRRMLAKGGEGGGKSVAGIVKTLERLRRGMHGMMGSPDFPHFSRSLWREFARWCPWEEVVPRHRYRGVASWEPARPFMLAFRNGATLHCGGFEEPGAWEGPNVHFAFFDEARRHKSPAMLKVLDGRCRLSGPNGEPPQLFLATTPRKHWLFEYFGPLIDDDPLADFKREALVIDLLTADNAAHLAPGLVESRRAGLSAQEARVLLEAAWEDIDDVERFLASLTLWDACRVDGLPPLDAHTPCILALDAGESSDCFACVIISLHPDDPTVLAVRYARAYVPAGATLDFDAIEEDIRDLVARYAIIEIAYDPFLLGQTVRRLTTGARPIATTFYPFPQGAERLLGDKNLHDLILSRRIVHDGDPVLRAHIDHADKKTNSDERTLRIVKRTHSLKIDMAVATAMGAYRAATLDGIGGSGVAGGTLPRYDRAPAGRLVLGGRP